MSDQDEAHFFLEEERIRNEKRYNMVNTYDNVLKEVKKICSNDVEYNSNIKPIHHIHFSQFITLKIIEKDYSRDDPLYLAPSRKVDTIWKDLCHNPSLYREFCANVTENSDQLIDRKSTKYDSSSTPRKRCIQKMTELFGYKEPEQDASLSFGSPSGNEVHEINDNDMTINNQSTSSTLQNPLVINSGGGGLTNTSNNTSRENTTVNPVRTLALAASSSVPAPAHALAASVTALAASSSVTAPSPDRIGSSSSTTPSPAPVRMASSSPASARIGSSSSSTTLSLVPSPAPVRVASSSPVSARIGSSSSTTPLSVPSPAPVRVASSPEEIRTTWGKVVTKVRETGHVNDDNISPFSVNQIVKSNYWNNRIQVRKCFKAEIIKYNRDKDTYDIKYLYDKTLVRGVRSKFIYDLNDTGDNIPPTGDPIFDDDSDDDDDSDRDESYKDESVDDESVDDERKTDNVESIPRKRGRPPKNRGSTQGTSSSEKNAKVQKNKIIPYTKAGKLSDRQINVNKT